MTEESEFGRGLVVCLAKFSQHMFDEWWTRATRIYTWYFNMTDGRKEKLLGEAKRYPEGDAARYLMDTRIFGHGEDEEGEEGKLRAISMQIELWANAASDHFYDLDESAAPPSLKKLAELTLRMGHGFQGRDGNGAPWLITDLEEVAELWEKACLEMDEMLGVETDWGQW